MPGTLISVYFSPMLALRVVHKAHIETRLISGKIIRHAKDWHVKMSADLSFNLKLF
jgi:hypothetical protein